MTKMEKPREEWDHRRIKMASMFYDDVLLPAIRHTPSIGSIDILRLISEYQNGFPILGNDFDVDHVWGTAVKRCLAIKQNDPSTAHDSPEDKETHLEAWRLLSILIRDQPRI